MFYLQACTPRVDRTSLFNISVDFNATRMGQTLGTSFGNLKVQNWDSVDGPELGSSRNSIAILEIRASIHFSERSLTA